MRIQLPDDNNLTKFEPLQPNLSRNARGRGFSGHYALPPMERFEVNPERARDQSEEPKNGQKRPPPLLLPGLDTLMPAPALNYGDQHSRMPQHDYDDGMLTPLSGHRARYGENEGYHKSRRWMNTG